MQAMSMTVPTQVVPKALGQVHVQAHQAYWTQDQPHLGLISTLGPHSIYSFTPISTPKSYTQYPLNTPLPNLV